MPDNTHQDARVERVLRSGAETAVPDWIAVRARLVARALSDDLVDVVYEDHDTPLGTMRVSATNTDRVIAAAGSLTGYRGGLQRKQALLDLEARGGAPDALGHRDAQQLSLL
jgi:hypothetical protein